MSKIKGQIALCDVKAKIRNISHSYCGTAKQNKMLRTNLKGRMMEMGEKMQNF